MRRKGTNRRNRNLGDPLLLAECSDVACKSRQEAAAANTIANEGKNGEILRESWLCYAIVTTANKGLPRRAHQTHGISESGFAQARSKRQQQ